MKPIYKAWLIQIEITNACRFTCAHCTHGVAHYRKPYFADLAFIEKALISLHDWPRAVGCIGGEPTLHPDFVDICALYRKHIKRDNCAIFTCGGKRYEEHRELIEQTFGIISYNDHSVVGKHQPLLVASRDIVPDDKLRNRLIDRCWLQMVWSPSITCKGCYFCEVAGTIDMLFDGPGGYPIEPGWWKRGVADFADQRERYCGQCGIALPMKSIPHNLPYEYVSKSNLEKLTTIGSPLAKSDRLRVIDSVLTPSELKQIKKDPNFNNDPSHHTSIGRHNWYTTRSKKYHLLFAIDYVKLLLRRLFGL
jgi:hypothetical protein